MFSKLLLCYFVGLLIFIQNINAQDQEEKCTYVDATESGKLYINDNHIITEPIICLTDNSGITDGEYNCNTFFTLKVNKSTFTYTVNDKYKDFEEYIFNGSKVSDISQYRRYENIFEMYGTCSVKGVSKDVDMRIQLYYEIIDNNNHNPTFETLSKEFTAAIPIMPGYDITLNNPLYVHDIDLTPSRITVSIDKIHDKDYFKATIINDSSKHFPFRIVNSYPWSENKPIELHLRAEDQDGNISDNPMIVKINIEQDTSPH